LARLLRKERFAMNDFAWKGYFEPQESERPRSQTRLRVVRGRASDVALCVHEVDLAVHERGTSDDGGIVMAMRLVERACSDLDRWSIMLGAQHVCDAWLDSCAQWVAGVGSTLVSAFSYAEGPERRIALALAAEESSMRLLMGMEREGKETIAVLKNLDGNAARAATELSARIELADRILQARL